MAAFVIQGLAVVVHLTIMSTGIPVYSHATGGPLLRELRRPHQPRPSHCVVHLPSVGVYMCYDSGLKHKSAS